MTRRGELPLRANSGGVDLRLKVAPRAARNGIGGLLADTDGGARLKISVTAAPDSGEANKAVIQLLAKDWRLPKSSLSIATGAAERRKVLHIDGEPTSLSRHLQGWWQRHPGR